MPLWVKYLLTIEEASQYFGIGINKIRKLVSDDQDAAYLLHNGNRILIKRGLFESYIDKANSI